MKWVCGVLAWLAFLIVMSGCKPDVPEAVVVNTPVQSHICQLVPPLYPGCDCPPAPCASGATPQIVVTYTSGPPSGSDGDPFIIPLSTVHSDGSGHKPPKPQRDGHDWDSTLTITIEVDTNGVAIPSVALHLVIDVADSGSTGSDSLFGHHHKSAASPKPKGRPSDTILTTPAGGAHTVTVVYTPSRFSEPVKLVISSAGVDTLRKHWTVGVPDLTHMSGSYIDLIGETTTLGSRHPNSHWVVSTMIPTLDSLAAKFHAVYSANLQVNDMSLRYGGKFDLDTLWGDTAHVEHRLGRSADISSLTAAQYANVVFWWKNAGFGLYFHPEAGNAHLRDWRNP